MNQEFKYLLQHENRLRCAVVFCYVLKHCSGFDPTFIAMLFFSHDNATVQSAEIVTSAQQTLTPHAFKTVLTKQLAFLHPSWPPALWINHHQPVGTNSQVHRCVILQRSQINVPLEDLEGYSVRNIPRWLNVCRQQHKSMIKCFPWACVSSRVHIPVCCFCLQACVGVEQIHVIWVIDVFPPAESWLRCLMETRLNIHSLFYFCSSLNRSRFDWHHSWPHPPTTLHLVMYSTVQRF